MVFQEVKQDDIVVFEKVGDQVIGTLMSSHPAKYGKAYVLNVDGKEKTMFGTAILDGLMADVKSGETVKVVYGGTIPTKKGNPAHVFKVFVDRPEEVIVK